MSDETSQPHAAVDPTSHRIIDYGMTIGPSEALDLLGLVSADQNALLERTTEIQTTFKDIADRLLTEIASLNRTTILAEYLKLGDIIDQLHALRTECNGRSDDTEFLAKKISSRDAVPLIDEITITTDKIISLLEEIETEYEELSDTVMRVPSTVSSSKNH